MARYTFYMGKIYRDDSREFIDGGADDTLKYDTFEEGRTTDYEEVEE